MNTELALQIFRFGITGLSNVVVDLAVYSALMFVGADIITAKALAFVAGTLFSFTVNRSWTFKSGHSWSSRILPFFLIYTLSMFVNVAINYHVVGLFRGEQLGYVVAYCSAVTVSSLINFVGMRAMFYNKTESRGRAC